MAFLDTIDDRGWISRTRSLLARHQRRAGGLRYTEPWDGAGFQSPWHSALLALVYRWFDPDMAADELRAAAAGAVADGPDAGMIPGEIRGETPGAERRAVTAPPLLAFAAMQVYHFSGDTNLLERVYPAVAAWHQWFDRRRDGDADGLVSIDYPNEFIVAGHAVNVNALRAADLDALGHLAADMGRRDDAARWDARAERVRRALSEQPLAIYTHVNATLLGVLFGRGASADDAARMLAQVQGSAPDGRPFPWLAESHSPVSMIDNWLIYLGLRRYGFTAQATRTVEASVQLAERAGFWQFYDPATGDGWGVPDFPAATLALDMLLREKSGRAPQPQCIQDVD